MAILKVSQPPKIAWALEVIDDAGKTIPNSATYDPPGCSIRERLLNFKGWLKLMRMYLSVFLSVATASLWKRQVLLCQIISNKNANTLK